MSIANAYGTTFKWNTYVVGELTNIGGVEVKADTVDVTTHASADAYKKFKTTLLDAGEVTLEGFYDPADTTGQQAMFTDCNARTERECIITFPAETGTTFTFNASVTTVKFGDAPVDGVIPFMATVKVSGKPVFAVAASVGLTTPFFSISDSAVITPAPSGTVYNYVATVLSAVATVTITPTSATEVITVNGNTVASGVPSSAIVLGAAGTVTTATVIVKGTSKSPKTYTINIARLGS